MPAQILRTLAMTSRPADLRMLDKQSRDALHPLADAPGALRRF
jgi:hypothetical protein